MIAFLKRQLFSRPNWHRTFKLAGFLAACCGCVVLWALAIDCNHRMASIGHANPPTPVAVATQTIPEAN